MSSSMGPVSNQVVHPAVTSTTGVNQTTGTSTTPGVTVGTTPPKSPDLNKAAPKSGFQTFLNIAKRIGLGIGGIALGIVAVVPGVVVMALVHCIAIVVMPSNRLSGFEDENRNYKMGANDIPTLYAKLLDTLFTAWKDKDKSKNIPTATVTDGGASSPGVNIRQLGSAPPPPPNLMNGDNLQVDKIKANISKAATASSESSDKTSGTQAPPKAEKDSAEMTRERINEAREIVEKAAQQRADALRQKQKDADKAAQEHQTT